MATTNGRLNDVDFYEEKYASKPRTQRIPKAKKKLDNTGEAKKKQRFDKKNAVRAPWKQDLTVSNVQE